MNTIVEEYRGERGGIRDAIKTLRSNIQFSAIDSEIRSIAVTSALPGEGKSTISCYLGISMAEEGKKTLLVECDCRKPKLRGNFKLRAQHNWGELLTDDSGQHKVEEYALPTRQEGLYLIDCIPNTPNSVEIFSSKRFEIFLNRAMAEFDVVICDTPPLGAFIDAALIAARTDGTLLVISERKVDAAKEQGVIDQLKKANARILGCVMNRVDEKEIDYHGYYSHYYSQNENPEK